MSTSDEIRARTYLKNEYVQEIKHFKKTLNATDSNYYWIIELNEDSKYFFKNYEYNRFICEKTLDLAIKNFNEHICKQQTPGE